MIKAKNIKTLLIVKDILDNLKPVEKYIDTLNENSYEYEDLCEKVGEQLCEIEESLIGKEPYNKNTICNADIRMMSYWDYLKEDIDFCELINVLKENSNKILLDM